MSKKKKTYFTPGRIVEGSGTFGFVGDIHGCYDELVELDAKVRADHPDITMVTLGDLVDRGPKVHEVVKFCRENNYLMVLGNHDEKMVRYFKGNAVKMQPHHQASADVLTEEDVQYFKDAALFIRFPHYKLIAVHGGFWPHKPPEYQNPKHMIRLNSINMDEKKLVKLEDVTPETTHWSEYWQGPEQVIYGHTAYDGEVHISKNAMAMGIDTGCVYGGKLTAAVAYTDSQGNKEIDLYQVDAKKAYWDYSKYPKDDPRYRPRK